jgi:hypothetical protein
MTDVPGPGSKGKRALGGLLVVTGAVAVGGAAWLMRPTATPVEPATAPIMAPPPPAPTPAPALAPTAHVPPAAPVPPVTALEAPRMAAATVKEVASAGGPIRFTERRYVPPLPLPIRAAASAPEALGSPEALMAESTSAMRRGDWDGWLALWDPQSRAYMAAQFAEAGVTREAMLAGWTREFATRTFVLVRRIDLPDHVIIYSRRSDADDESPEAHQPLAMKRDASGRWWLSHELRESPVFFYDSSPALDVREVGRPPPAAP